MSLLLLLILLLASAVVPLAGALAALLFRGKGHPERATWAWMGVGLWLLGGLVVGLVAPVAALIAPSLWLLLPVVLGLVLQAVAGWCWGRTWSVAVASFVASVSAVLGAVFAGTTGLLILGVDLGFNPYAFLWMLVTPAFLLWLAGAGVVVALGGALTAERVLPEGGGER